MVDNVEIMWDKMACTWTYSLYAKMWESGWTFNTAEISLILMIIIGNITMNQVIDCVRISNCTQRA